ncbi:MAG TPA: cupin domain-containing protein [Desulfovibrio sp.]|jgi:quercetin dioxygenase-like cupin family protein|uniref:cupin domain-containing protein n=1 Tax=Desulfovibrio TaxID=872 RepID=UPI002A39866C|nr:cupin domain-containing protein [Desulfovibrio sp.]MDY0304850.1 cupin domain-containing protein [Desulfovibrionaceae bacterium]HMM39536.1 cupin domain-containing protein [Desulfovibrio sp.]
MKRIELFKENGFKDKGFSPLFAHESPYMKVVNFNFEPGQELPVHSHDIEGELVIAVLEGRGEFLSKDGALPAETGDILVSPIATPHGLRAATRMRVLVTIAPPI